MELQCFTTELLDTNCYVVIEDKVAIVVDPAGIGAELLTFLAERQAQLMAIINTHGHIDHILQNTWLQEHTGAPIWVHEAESPYLLDPELNLSSWILGEPRTSPAAARYLHDGEEIKLGSLTITVLHTPGHSPGSICLLGPGFLISGDTLFQCSVGRTDFPGGSVSKLQQSLQRLKELPADTVVYPGHGSKTTIAQELIHNPFLR